MLEWVLCPQLSALNEEINVVSDLHKIQFIPSTGRSEHTPTKKTFPVLTAALTHSITFLHPRLRQMAALTYVRGENNPSKDMYKVTQPARSRAGLELRPVRL